MTQATLANPKNEVQPRPNVRESPLVVFAGGGTGGHLFPMLSVAEALGAIQNSPCRNASARNENTYRFAFFGSSRAIDRDLIRIADAELVQQTVRPVSLRPWKWPGFYWHWRSSRRACRQYFARYRPAVVIGSGGFASGPPICEAINLGIPTVLLNPDAVPGRANRYLGRRADHVFVQWAETCGFFHGHRDCVVTGCPTRGQFRRPDRSRGIEHFGLRPDLKTLLVTGASQGAASINSAILALVNDLRNLRDWQILHLAGAHDLERTAAAYREHRVIGKVAAFTDRMAEAMAAADLIVSRAGASTLAEITGLGKPSVLMPYPYHRDMHQRANARVLSGRGAAVLVEDRIDADRTVPELREALMGLMHDDGRRAQMSSAANRLGAIDAAESVAVRIEQMIGARGENGR